MSLTFVRIAACLLMFYSWVFSANTYAQQCQAALSYAVILEPQHIRFTENYRTVIQINHNKQLFIKGREINLTAENTELVKRYAFDIRTKIPEVINLVNDGIRIRLNAMDKMIGGLTGENSQSHLKAQDSLNELQRQLIRRFYHSDDSFIIAPQDFNDVDQFLTEEVSDELEGIITSSLSSIFSAFDLKPKSIETDNLEQRMMAFGKQLDIITDDMEWLVRNQTAAISDKANQYCLVLSEIAKTEQTLLEAIPNLQPYRLLKMQQR